MSITEKEQVPSKKMSFKKMVTSRLLIRPPVESDPRLKPSRQKSLILTCLCLGSCLPGLSSTVYFPAMPVMTADLNAPSVAVTLTTSLFVLFMGIAPIFWAVMADHYRIRKILIETSLVIFIIASLGCALVSNVWGLVVLRCIQSIGASCTSSVGAGAIAVSNGGCEITREYVGPKIIKLISCLLHRIFIPSMNAVKHLAISSLVISLVPLLDLSLVDFCH